MVDGLGARAAAGGDRASEGIPQDARFERAIDAGLSTGARATRMVIRGQDRAIECTHDLGRQPKGSSSACAGLASRETRSMVQTLH
jgi:hypothetical protein